MLKYKWSIRKLFTFYQLDLVPTHLYPKNNSCWDLGPKQLEEHNISRKKKSCEITVRNFISNVVLSSPALLYISVKYPGSCQCSDTQLPLFSMSSNQAFS